MEGFRVKCCTCGQVMYETTELYNCHQPLTGDMLRLLPFYRDWPTYDGSLASKATSRFLMFCSQCAGYISTTGKLDFVDFPHGSVTEISEERSKLADSHEFYECIASVCINAVQQTKCKIQGPIESFTLPDVEVNESKNDHVGSLIVSDTEDSPLKDDSQPMTPEALIKEIEKVTTFSRNKRSKKGKRK